MSDAPSYVLHVNSPEMAERLRAAGLNAAHGLKPEVFELCHGKRVYILSDSPEDTPRKNHAEFYLALKGVVAVLVPSTVWAGGSMTEALTGKTGAALRGAIRAAIRDEAPGYHPRRALDRARYLAARSSLPRTRRGRRKKISKILEDSP